MEGGEVVAVEGGEVVAEGGLDVFEGGLGGGFVAVGEGDPGGDVADAGVWGDAVLLGEVEGAGEGGLGLGGFAVAREGEGVGGPGLVAVGGEGDGAQADGLGAVGLDAGEGVGVVVDELDAGAVALEVVGFLEVEAGFAEVGVFEALGADDEVAVGVVGVVAEDGEGVGLGGGLVAEAAVDAEDELEEAVDAGAEGAWTRGRRV